MQILVSVNPLKSSGNSAAATASSESCPKVCISVSCYSIVNVYYFINSITQLIFVMVMGCVFFEVQAEILRVNMSFDSLQVADSFSQSDPIPSGFNSQTSTQPKCFL
jgi:hypothetical protein